MANFDKVFVVVHRTLRLRGILVPMSWNRQSGQKHPKDVEESALTTQESARRPRWELVPVKPASEAGGFHLLRSCSSSNWDNSREQIKVEPGTREFQVGQISRQTRFCKEIACLQKSVMFIGNSRFGKTETLTAEAIADPGRYRLVNTP